MKLKKGKKKNSKTEKKIGIGNPFKGLSVRWQGRSLLPHIVSTVSLLPILIAIWFAIPSFSFNLGNSTVEVTSVLERFTTTIDRFGFKEGYDLQEGVSIKYTIEIPETKTSSGTTSSGTTPDGVQAGTGEVSIDENQQKVDEIAQLDKTINLLNERVEKSGIPDREIQKVQIDEDSYSIILNLGGSREDLGTALPTLFPLKGNVSVWVDDPKYSSTGSNTSGLGFLEGKTQTDITSDEVVSAQVVNDIQTNGRGLKVTFANSAITKLITAAQNIGQSEQPNSQGFVIVIDGIPVMIQSIYAAPTANAIYFLPLNASESVINTMATVINQPELPFNIGFASSNTNIVEPPTRIDNGLFKGVIILGLVVFSLILIYKYRYQSILLILLNIGIFSGSIAVHKLMKSYLTIELLLGLMAGMILVNLFVKHDFENLINWFKQRNIEKISKVAKDLKRSSVLFFLIPMIFVIFIFSSVSTPSMTQFMGGIGLSFACAIVLIWTSISAFINEIFILPIKNAKKI